LMASPSCQRCSTRKRSDGGTEYFHAFLGATIVAPGHQQVLPLPPEFIAPRDGAEKQDCERNAAKRWLERHGPAVAHRRPIFLGDDLFACQPIATVIQRVGGNFILTCKPASHQTIAEYLHGAELEQHRQTAVTRGKRTTTIYRWLAAVPLRATDDALAVNWFSIEIRDGNGKRAYYNSFITDLPVTAAAVAELAACGRARWKIENETFNVLKTGGYNLEHNFGHGKQTLASVLVVLNRLRIPHRRPARRVGMARGHCRTRSNIPVLRTFADRHRLRRVPELGSFAPLHRRRRDPAALIAATNCRPIHPHSTRNSTTKKHHVRGIWNCCCVGRSGLAERSARAWEDPQHTGCLEGADHETGSCEKRTAVLL
jgi:hypothetical protein